MLCSNTRCGSVQPVPAFRRPPVVRLQQHFRSTYKARASGERCNCFWGCFVFYLLQKHTHCLSLIPCAAAESQEATGLNGGQVQRPGAPSQSNCPFLRNLPKPPPAQVKRTTTTLASAAVHGQPSTALHGAKNSAGVASTNAAVQLAD